jgi:hypothetical protein
LAAIDAVLRLLSEPNERPVDRVLRVLDEHHEAWIRAQVERGVSEIEAYLASLDKEL